MEQHADGRYGPWELIDRTWSKIIDGGDPNSNDHVFYTHPRGEDATGGRSLQVAFMRILNRSGSPVDFGWGCRLHKSSWVAGQWVHSTTTYTDDTVDAQDAGTADFACDTLTNGDGYLVAAMGPFNAISINGSQANTGSPVRVAEYSVAGGTWATTTNVLVSAFYTAGESVVWIQPPTNWAVLEAGHGTGVPIGKYGLRIRATTAPTQAALATTISVHRIYGLVRQLASNAVSVTDFAGFYAPLDPNGEAISMITSSPAVSHNATMLVRARG